MPEEHNQFDNDLIKANLIPADIKLYVVTKDRLNNITHSSILSDILALLASIAWGAFISFFIASHTSPVLSNISVVSIFTYKHIFLCAGIVLTIIFALTKWNQYNQISGITKSKLNLPDNE